MNFSLKAPLAGLNPQAIRYLPLRDFHHHPYRKPISETDAGSLSDYAGAARLTSSFAEDKGAGI
jgi:hypothetical protein